MFHNGNGKRMGELTRKLLLDGGEQIELLEAVGSLLSRHADTDAKRRVADLFRQRGPIRPDDEEVLEQLMDGQFTPAEVRAIKRANVHVWHASARSPQPPPNAGIERALSEAIATNEQDRVALDQALDQVVIAQDKERKDASDPIRAAKARARRLVAEEAYNNARARCEGSGSAVAALQAQRGQAQLDWTLQQHTKEAVQ